jgi:hypothetical protein
VCRLFPLLQQTCVVDHLDLPGSFGSAAGLPCLFVFSTIGRVSLSNPHHLPYLAINYLLLLPSRSILSSSFDSLYCPVRDLILSLPAAQIFLLTSTLCALVGIPRNLIYLILPVQPHPLISRYQSAPMISIQVPHFLNHHPLPAYSPMSHPGFLHGMSAISKPAPMPFVSNSENRPKSITPGAKRRPSRAGTRSVATLTAAQLERKRANDRE